MNMRPKYDWTDRADLQVAIIVTALWAALTLAAFWGTFPQDLSALYFAGRFWAAGASDLVYAAPPKFFGYMTDPNWVALKAELGLAEYETFAFVYPPIWAAILGPVTSIFPPQAFFNCIYGFHVAMIAGMVWLFWRMTATSMPKSIWAVLSFLMAYAAVSVSLSLLHNQPQITVSFLMVLALERYIAGRSASAGVALGIAAALKLSPIVLVLLFVLDRNWRAVAATGIVSGGIALLSFVVAGADLHWVFVDRLRLISEQIILTNVNFSIELFIYEIGKLLQNAPFWPDAENRTPSVTMLATKPGWIAILSKLLLVAGLIGALWATRGLALRERTLLRFGSIWAIATLCAPLSWSHHYLPLTLMIPVLWRYLRPRGFVLFYVVALITQSSVLFELLTLVDGFHATAFVGVASVVGLMILLLVIASKLRGGRQVQ